MSLSIRISDCEPYIRERIEQEFGMMGIYAQYYRETANDLWIRDLRTSRDKFTFDDLGNMLGVFYSYIESGMFDIGVNIVIHSSFSTFDFYVFESFRDEIVDRRSEVFEWLEYVGEVLDRGFQQIPNEKIPTLADIKRNKLK